MDLYRFDEDYLNRLRSADEETQLHFSAYFSRMLTLKLRNRLRRPEALEDIKQETLLRVLRSLSSVRDAEKLGAYVNTTCNFVLLEYFRAGKRETALDDEHDPPDLKVNLEENAVSVETCKQVRTALEKLDPKDRDLLKALFIDEQDKDKICKKFGVDRDYLRVLLYRAKANFRKNW